MKTGAEGESVVMLAHTSDIELRAPIPASRASTQLVELEQSTARIVGLRSKLEWLASDLAARQERIRRYDGELAAARLAGERDSATIARLQAELETHEALLERLRQELTELAGWLGGSQDPSQR